MKDNYLVVEAVGMWESRRDFQRVWEGWEAGFLAFHAFHTLSFPWPAFRSGDAGFTATSTSAMGRTRREAFVVIVADECFGDFALIEITTDEKRVTKTYHSAFAAGLKLFSDD
jgi:hypothetical protein